MKGVKIIFPAHLAMILLGCCISTNYQASKHTVHFPFSNEISNEEIMETSLIYDFELINGKTVSTILSQL